MSFKSPWTPTKQHASLIIILAVSMHQQLPSISSFMRAGFAFFAGNEMRACERHGGEIKSVTCGLQRPSSPAFPPRRLTTPGAFPLAVLACNPFLYYTQPCPSQTRGVVDTIKLLSLGSAS